MKKLLIMAVLAMVPAMANAQTPAPAEQTAFTVQVASQRMVMAVAPTHLEQGDAAVAQNVNKLLNHTLKLTGLFDFLP